MNQLTLGSLFDGIGGFPLAGIKSGIHPVWASEIEPFPVRVTQKRLPDMKHYGDVSKLNGGDLEPVDIITFGSPCQDLSIAGKRNGLDGARSGLFREAIRIITEMRCKTNGRSPRWAVWENVPGALSSANGHDFREVLESLIRIKDPEADVPMPDSGKWLPAGEILGDNYSLAWRILDASKGWGVAQRRKRIFEAFVSGYTEIPEGADVAQLTPQGVIAYVEKYAEVTTGADVSGLTPEIAACFVAGYQELAEGADVSLLKPSDVVAYVTSYAEEQGVDISGLAPDGVTAFVMAYQEIEGGALTTTLKPSDVAAIVTQYLLDENVDLSKVTDAQVDAMVTAYAEAANCDKTALKAEVVAQITEYVQAEGLKPPILTTKVQITGYEYLTYQDFQENSGLSVEVPVRLGEVSDTDLAALSANGKIKVWQDGIEIPVTAVPEGAITADTIATMDEDGTMHILISPQVTGTQEAIEAISPLVDEVDKLGVTTAGMWAGIMPATTMDLIGSAVSRINSYTKTLDYNGWQKFWAALRGESTDHGVLDQSMRNDFNSQTVAELSAYVGEMVAAIMQGKQVSEEDIANLQAIVTFLNGLDTTETGAHILEGVAQGMTEAGWDTDAETVAANLESALNMAFDINSPSERVKPVGDNVAAGVGAGMSAHDFSTDASTVASAIETAISTAFPAAMLASYGTAGMQGIADAMTDYSMSATGSTVGSNVKSAVNSSLTSTTLRSAGVNAMAGLKAGINAGRSGVISAMRSAARAAVSAAKSELKIKSPSRVFEDEVGVMTMRGFGQGVLKESKEQARVIRNASRYLTGEAKNSAIAYSSSDNRRTYNNSVNSTIQVAQMVIRDEQDIRSLAVEIATLTRRQQRGKGAENGMNDWFEWNGVKCTDYGIYVTEQPPPTISEERVTFTDVPGRSGSLTTLEGDYVYNDMVLTATCVISDPDRIPEIAGWLRGSGTVTFANRDGGFYYARIINQIPFEKILRGNPHRTFAVNFRCKPFWYEADVAPKNIQPASGSTSGYVTMQNPGNVPSEPIITVTGSGEITLIVDMTIVELSDVNGEITIDSVLQEAYSGITSMNSSMSGDFPTLPPGNSTISWTGNVTYLKVQPNWRYL